MEREKKEWNKILVNFVATISFPMYPNKDMLSLDKLTLIL